MGVADTPSPTVSVIMPVWNVEPWLRQCLDSVLEQSIGFESLELIAVDDGSTDASGAILDEYGARHPNVIVVHDENSGGAGRPRNHGLDQARGNYVFFLDADDYLGPECLERLVAMAERARSDIVLGKIVGVEGRRRIGAAGAFRQTVERADLEQVYRSLNVLKLFRRSFIERTGLRFPEGVAGGEDGDLMARLYLDATVVSVVADYDCYFLRRRPTSPGDEPERRDDRLSYFARLEAERIRPVAAQRGPGIARDMLLLRHVRKLLRKFNAGWLALPPEQRREVFDAAAGILDRWHSTLMDRSLPAWAAIRAYCLQHGLLEELEDVVACRVEVAFREPRVVGRRIYARFPHFRDRSGIPDRCFEITREVVAQHDLERAVVTDGRLELAGQAFLALVGGSTTVELRRWPRGESWRFETEQLPTPQLRDKEIAYPAAGYRIAIDLATAAGGKPLGRGTWAVRLSIGTSSIRRELPVRAPRQRSRRPAEGSAIAIGRRGLRLGPGRELRLVVGRSSVGERLLGTAEAGYHRASRLLIRGLSASRPGRLLQAGLRKVRPGSAAPVADD